MAGEVQDEAGLWAVPERGGDVQEILLAGETTHFHGTSALPGGRGFLTTRHERPHMRVSVVAGDKISPLFEIETTYLPDPTYASTGHILYYRGGTNVGVWARPFSLESLEVTGEPFLVAAQAGVSGHLTLGKGARLAAKSGVLLTSRGTTTPPARSVPIKTMTQVGELGAQSSTRSPFSTPLL